MLLKLDTGYTGKVQWPHAGSRILFNAAVGSPFLSQLYVFHPLRVYTFLSGIVTLVLPVTCENNDDTTKFISR